MFIVQDFPEDINKIIEECYKAKLLFMAKNLNRPRYIILPVNDFQKIKQYFGTSEPFKVNGFNHHYKQAPELLGLSVSVNYYDNKISCL